MNFTTPHSMILLKVYMYLQKIIINVNTLNNINNIHYFIEYSKFNKINFNIIIKLVNVFIKHINEHYVDSTKLFINLIKLDIKNNIIEDEKYNNKTTIKLYRPLE